MPCSDTSDDVPDADTGLTPRQKRAIRDSWRLVNADADKHGVELLLRLFREDPKTRGYFPNFKLMNEDELRMNSIMTSHAGKVMEGVTTLVDNLDMVPVLVKTVKQLARDHHSLGVKSQDFETVLNVLQRLLKDGLAEKYNDVTSGAWKQCCHVIHSIVDSEMKLLRQ